MTANLNSATTSMTHRHRYSSLFSIMSMIMIFRIGQVDAFCKVFSHICDDGTGKLSCTTSDDCVSGFCYEGFCKFCTTNQDCDECYQTTADCDATGDDCVGVGECNEEVKRIRGTMNLSDKPTKARSLQIMKDLGANPNAVFSHKNGLLTKEESLRIKNFIESSEIKEARPESGAYNVPISVDTLINLIGEESLQNTLEFFDESLGRENVPITRIHGRFMPASEYHHHYHIDEDGSTLLIELNDGYTGGEVVYLSNEGPTVPKRDVGSAVVHGSDIAHAVTTHKGSGRYSLFFLSSNNPQKNKIVDKEMLVEMI